MRIKTHNTPFWITATILAALVAGCARIPMRITADGCSDIPLEGFGEKLPQQGPQGNGQSTEIDYESLYVRFPSSTSSIRTGKQRQSIVRFWPNGSALSRGKLIDNTGRAGDVHRFSAYDGQFLSDWIAAPSPESRHQFSVFGYPYKWCIYKGHIYIEVYGFTPGGREFILRRGPVTPDGFVINERYSNPLIGSKWQPITPRHYIKQHVGKMIGEPTW